ncbi:MAG: ROK family protein [Ancrocorticia sp.]|uniref:ROK family protein n=1 Tax=Ancrocorticia sp. TaxID=2593684 RepID=UPI003F921C74
MSPRNGSAALTRASTAAALDHAWSCGAFLADDVAHAKDLTKSTAMKATEILIEAGLVRELPNTLAEGSYRFGRPARRFELREDAGLLVGTDAGRSHITTVVADLKGHILSRSRRPIEPTEDHALGRRVAVSEAITAALESAGQDPENVLALAIGIPAPVTDGTSPTHHAGFWERMNPGFREYFADKFPIVRVENDAALAALAERSQGAARSLENFVAMLAGNRMGAGVMLGGQLAYGAHGGVGELGILKYLHGAGSSKGLVDLTDRWIREALADGSIPPSHPLANLAPDSLTPDTELSYISADDPALALVIERASSHLARIGELLAYLYDPEIIIVSGGIANSIGPVLARANAKLQDTSHVPAPPLVASTLGHDVVSIGAVAAASDAARSGVLALKHEGSLRT